MRHSTENVLFGRVLKDRTRMTHSREGYDSVASLGQDLIG